MQSASGSLEEKYLLEALRVMMGGDDGSWGSHWLCLSLDSVLKAPVSQENAHHASLLRQCCLVPANLQRVSSELLHTLRQTTDVDIRSLSFTSLTPRTGLLSVLFVVLLPHCRAGLDAVLTPEDAATLLAMTRSLLPENSTSLPQDKIPLFLVRVDLAWVMTRVSFCCFVV